MKILKPLPDFKSVEEVDAFFATHLITDYIDLSGSSILEPFEDDTYPRVDENILLLQQKLSLPDDFFQRLLDEDDWSFIIKLHALIEAACTSLLTNHFDEPKLESIISRLELSNKTSGKMAFLKELGLLQDIDRRYITMLSELRNSFVHNVQNCHASLDDMVAQMEIEELKRFTLGFGHYAAKLRNLFNWRDFDGKRAIDSKELSDLADKGAELRVSIDYLLPIARNNPRYFIWMGAYSLLVSLSESENYSGYLKYKKAIKIIEVEDSND